MNKTANRVAVHLYTICATNSGQGEVSFGLGCPLVVAWATVHCESQAVRQAKRSATNSRWRSGHLADCRSAHTWYFAVTSGKPVELDVALVVNGVSDRRECAQHRLPELKACGMLLQSIFARHGPHSD